MSWTCASHIRAQRHERVLSISAICALSIAVSSRALRTGDANSGGLFTKSFMRNVSFLAVKAINLLYFRISWDYDFLIRAHAEVIKTDEFTRRMAEILTHITREGIHQKLTLLTQRADYMAHCCDSMSSPTLKQIEVNNIAVSMGGLAQKMTSLHRRMLAKIGLDEKSIFDAVPDNFPIRTLVTGIYEAW